MKAQIQHKDSSGVRWILNALVPFVQLKDTVLFTYRANTDQTKADNKGEFKSSMDFYQRRVDSKRSDEIKEFIRNSILQERQNKQMATLFPTSMILALKVDEDGNTLRENDEEWCDLDVKSNVFIVDGQHRMMGMRKLFYELDGIKIRKEDDEYVYNFLCDYKFNCTILVNYDLWEQGQVFINVNFKQKPVNKSLYYEIFGSEYRENESDWSRNKIYLAHSMTRMLNEHKASPFYQRVKMLGTGKGYVSQAFVVEALQRLFKNGALWYFDPDTMKSGDEDINYMGTELLSFFVAIKRLFPNYWPHEDSTKGTIICKTTGVGAWIRLMGLMRQDEDYEMLYALKQSAKKEEVCELYIDNVSNIISPLQSAAEILFGKDSEFRSSSGRGSEVKLYKKMLYYIHNPMRYNKEKDKYPFDSNVLSEKIQEYVWENHIEDIAPLGHHCDVEDISAFRIVNYNRSNDVISVKARFMLSVNIYLDKEGDTGFFMQFPSECEMELEKKGEKFELNKRTVRMSVDTEKFYQ